MNELHLQDKFVVPFFTGDLGFREVKPNTVTSSLIIEEDLLEFISTTQLNLKPFQLLLEKYEGNVKKLLNELIEVIQERIRSSRNMALFLNANKTISLCGVKLYLFYTSDSVLHGDELFNENIFSIVQELPYKYSFGGKQIFSFRPDMVIFVNGMYFGYSELKSNYTNQNAIKNGRGKVIKDYFEATRIYQQVIDANELLSDREKDFFRKDFLKIFEKAIHITTTDIGETFVIRNIADYFDDILQTCRESKFEKVEIEKTILSVFKPYPLLKPENSKKDKLKELFGTHYGKKFIEKEFLYYNFIEREVFINSSGNKEVKNEMGRLVSPRPKQKFGTDKILSKIDEFLFNESDPDYYEKLLELQLKGVSEQKKKELLEKRKAYSNNKNIYSLLMQYAAGFGKSNIIGWTALQLKDLRRNNQFVYDKVIIVVDRLQLRGQLDSLLLNMNIDKRMFIEASNRKAFEYALDSDIRLVVVNLQKFGSVKEILDADNMIKLSTKRIVFLIDEIHRSNSGEQHEEMVSIFDELQTPFDSDKTYSKVRKKKNLIIGFTATPDDHTLARFGEYSGYAENEKLWRPFDSYTMREAIEDGFILNPLKNIIPIASKMIFDLPENELEGFKSKDYKDIDKKQIYENPDRIKAISSYIADLLVKDVYRQIRGTGKAMLAVYSIKAAIAYKQEITRVFSELVKQERYSRYSEAPVHIVYSDSQDQLSSSSLNEGLSEEKVIEGFSLKKNGLIIVVAKLQTGFDEKKLHTLFLDKEIKGISAIQTISRVNRTTKNKNDCKIIDFSYNNANVQNIKNAFEHFSDLVVSDFDPFGDKKVLEQLLDLLLKSEIYYHFYKQFMAIFSSKELRENPESFLDYESKIQKYIEVYPKLASDMKVKASQYFSILNKIEYVIDLEEKYQEHSFLFFWRKYNILYNQLNRSPIVKDPIEVYFDNQIGIIEVKPKDVIQKLNKPTKVAVAGEEEFPFQFDIMAIIAARNEQEALTGNLIVEFETKIKEFFEYIKNNIDGERLIVKLNSDVREEEIYEDFAKVYRKYKILNRAKVGDFFFKELDDLLEKLCDDFSQYIGAK